MSTVELTLYTLIYFTMDLFFIIFIFSISQTFFSGRLYFFGPNSIAIKSNLLAKNKIIEQRTIVKNTPQINDGFRVHTNKLF